MNTYAEDTAAAKARDVIAGVVFEVGEEELPAALARALGRELTEDELDYAWLHDGLC